MINKIFKKIKSLIVLFGIFILFDAEMLIAQIQGDIEHEIRWIKVGSLHNWFSNGGVEIEYGRRGRAGFTNTDQIDGLNWPGEYIGQDVNVGQSLWLGTTNFTDPVTGITYPHKVVSAGRINIDLGNAIFPVSHELIAKSEHSDVYVDDVSASFLEFDDVPDRIDENLPCDRMIITKFNTSIGISCTRKIYAFTQQNHDNYYIYEYVFKNTGIIDESSTPKLNKTLTGVIFHWQFRYAFPGESYREGWSPTGVSWGRNTINDCVGQDVNHLDPITPNMRAIWSYYGPVSTSGNYQDDIGLPRTTSEDILAGTNYAGVVTLHADKSTSDHTDDKSQPFTTKYMGSDLDAQGNNQYDQNSMTRKYTEFMSGRHLAQTQAELVGESFADNFGSDNGGYAAAQGYGPYTMAIGDSIKIVYAQAVAGIMKDREHVREIHSNWFNWKEGNPGNYIMPDGSTTNDGNTYKNAWVLSGKDSLFNSFRRAINNYNSGLNIPKAPPAPKTFNVVSAGNAITLDWSDEAVSDPHFDGYEIYRAVGRYDTTFTKIFSCNKSNVVHNYEDRDLQRGFKYYYYVVSKDDGTQNDFKPGEPLRSSKFYTMTTIEALLTRPAGKNWSQLRIVPNPYNIRAREIQFTNDDPDKIAIYDLPGKCDIKIYTESGTLIETMQHRKNTGDVYYFSLTSARQLIVSGIYILYFEVTEDLYDDVTGELLFKKGENAFRKLIVIR